MVVTNTGGSRLVRYGDVRSRLLGLEVVLLGRPGRRHAASTPEEQHWPRLQTALRRDLGCLRLRFPCGRQARPQATAVRDRTGRSRLDSECRSFSSSAMLERELGEFVSAYEAISHGTHSRSRSVTGRPTCARPSARPRPAYAVLIELSSVVQLKDQCDLEHASGADALRIRRSLRPPRAASRCVEVLIGRGRRVLEDPPPDQREPPRRRVRSWPSISPSHAAASTAFTEEVEPPHPRTRPLRPRLRLRTLGRWRHAPEPRLAQRADDRRTGPSSGSRSRRWSTTAS